MLDDQIGRGVSGVVVPDADTISDTLMKLEGVSCILSTYAVLDERARGHIWDDRAFSLLSSEIADAITALRAATGIGDN